MESVIMTPGSSTRLKSRLRHANNFLTRNSKSRQTTRNHTINHKNKCNYTRPHPQRINGNVKNVNCNQNGNQNSLNNNENITTTSNINTLYRGKFTREVYSAICGRLGQTSHIPGDSVKTLFNDMHLFPSSAQVSEMLQCARQCGRRNGAPTFLTFGEFCIFAREMQNQKSHRKQSHKTKKYAGKCEVFLGGSCNPTTWRTDTAIPELQKYGISYYNPQVPSWAPELVAQEHDAKQSASVLLYVVDSQTRSVAGMIEVAYLVAAGRCVVLVTHPFRLGQSIMGETITNREYMDLENGQTALLALVKSRGIKVHSNLTSALQCTTSLLRTSSANNGLSAEEQITYKLRKLREAFDIYDRNRTGELNLDEALYAYYNLTNRRLDRLALYNYLNTSDSDLQQTRISFEQFCALCAEFSVDGCENFTTDDWVSQPFQRQCSRNNNTHSDEVNGHVNCNTNENTYNYRNSLVDIYLGGSCQNSQLWREQVIPLITKRGLSYYNPELRQTNYYRMGFYYDDNDSGFANISENKILEWKSRIDNSRVLMFVITNDTRSLTTMILAAYYIGLNKDVVLCIQHLNKEDSDIGEEKLSEQAVKDYNRGRVYLADLAKRNHIQVFQDISEAVQCAIEKCQNR